MGVNVKRLNWVFLPVLYPIAAFAGIVTWAIMRLAFEEFPLTFRWHMDEAWRMTLAIIREQPLRPS